MREPNLGLVKLLAYGGMCLDHYALICAPQLVGLRLVGQFAMPWFICLAGYAWANVTRDRDQYVRRLCFVGIVSQPVYSWALGLPQANVILTIALGLACAAARDPWRVWVLMGLGAVGVLEHGAGFPLVDGSCFAVAAVTSAAWGWWSMVAALMYLAHWYNGGPVEVLAGVISAVAVGAFVVSWVVKWQPLWMRGRGWYWFYAGHLATYVILSML